MSEAKQGKIDTKASKKKEVEVIDPRERQRQRIEAERQKKNRTVRGRFMFLEVPQGRTVFPWRAYPGDPVKTYTLVDGEIYTIPICLAEHLNNNCKYAIYEHEMSPSEAAIKQQLGHPVKVKRYVHRYSFQPLDFMGSEDLQAISPSPDIVEVEHR